MKENAPGMRKDYCTQCGSPNLTDTRFCTSCGAAISQSERPVEDANPQRTVPTVPAMAEPRRTPLRRRISWAWIGVAALVAVAFGAGLLLRSPAQSLQAKSANEPPPSGTSQATPPATSQSTPPGVVTKSSTSAPDVATAVPGVTGSYEAQMDGSLCAKYQLLFVLEGSASGEVTGEVHITCGDRKGTEEVEGTTNGQRVELWTVRWKSNPGKFQADNYDLTFDSTWYSFRGTSWCPDCESEKGKRWDVRGYRQT